MEPVYKGQQRAMAVISCVMTAFGTLALVLRILSRWMIVQGLGYDDWLMVVGLLCTGGYLFECLYGIHFGIAQHGSTLSPNEMVTLLKIIYAIQLTYNTGIAAIKLSIVAFYLRLGSTGHLRTLSYATIGFLVVLYITTQTTSMLQCLPIQANWAIFDASVQARAKCINTTVFFYVVAGVNILVDIWIIGLPIKTLSGIKRPKRDKIVLFVVFGVGGFSCISSIIRLYTIKVFTKSSDPFYSGAPINIWSFIEMNVAIVCASVPAMKPLFSKAARDRVGTSSKSQGYNRSKSYPMVPLSGSDTNLTDNPYRERINMNKATYSAHATTAKSKYGEGDSEENIVSKHGTGGIEYAREFTFEEQYIGDSDSKLEKPSLVHQE